MMCNCRSISWNIGTRPSIVMTHPPTGAQVSIDPCIAHVIPHLWAHGIFTGGCCCGHNRRGPWVGLLDKSRTDEARKLITEVDDRDWEII